MKNHQIVEIVFAVLGFGGFYVEAEKQIPRTGSEMEAAARSSTIDERVEGNRPSVELLQDLKSKDVARRRKAAFGLSWKAPLHDLSAIPLLIEALADENADVRREVARVLGKCGPQAKAAVPTLLKIVKNKDDETRLSAAAALGLIGGEAKEAVPALVEILQENNYIAREAAAKALGGIGREARAALINLRKAMSDCAPAVQVAAAAALWRISGSAAESIPVLIDVLQDKHVPDDFDLIGLEIGRAFDIPVSRPPSKDDSSWQRSSTSFLGGSRREAARVLGEIGHGARAAVPALRKVAKEDSGWVQFGSVSALVSIAPESVEIIPALRAALREDDEVLRFQAVICLDRLGDKAKTDLLPHFIEALNDKSRLVQSGAMIALRKLGSSAKNAAPSLIKILQSDETLRHITASTLEAIGPQARAVVPQLIILLQDENSEKRRLAADILATIGLDAAIAVPTLVNALGDSDGDVRKSAANALQKVNPSAMPKKGRKEKKEGREEKKEGRDS